MYILIYSNHIDFLFVEEYSKLGHLDINHHPHPGLGTDSKKENSVALLGSAPHNTCSFR